MIQTYSYHSSLSFFFPDWQKKDERVFVGAHVSVDWHDGLVYDAVITQIFTQSKYQVR